jgi:hypothetical protein
MDRGLGLSEFNLLSLWGLFLRLRAHCDPYIPRQGRLSLIQGLINGRSYHQRLCGPEVGERAAGPVGIFQVFRNCENLQSGGLLGSGRLSTHPGCRFFARCHSDVMIHLRGFLEMRITSRLKLYLFLLCSKAVLHMAVLKHAVFSPTSMSQHQLYHLSASSSGASSRLSSSHAVLPLPAHGGLYLPKVLLCHCTQVTHSSDP